MNDRKEIYSACAPLVEKIEKWRESRNFIVNELTWLDFLYFECLEVTDWISEGDLKSKNPRIKEYCERMTALPNFKEAWADDTKTMKYPFNNRHAFFGGQDAKN